MLIKIFSNLKPEACKIKQTAGFTLLEVIITIVVIGIAATTIMSVFINTVKTSADPLIQQQAILIAQAYMEEIQSKHFSDPTEAETGGAEAGENRATYDDVQDYNGLNDIGAMDQGGNAIVGLSGYSVTISVSGQPLTGGSTIAAANAMRIDIRVDHAVIDPIRLSGFRTNH